MKVITDNPTLIDSLVDIDTPALLKFVDTEDNDINKMSVPDLFYNFKDENLFLQIELTDRFLSESLLEKGESTKHVVLTHEEIVVIYQQLNKLKLTRELTK